MCHVPRFEMPMYNESVGSTFPLIFHQSWKTTNLPNEFLQSRKTCLRHNPNFKSILWTDDMNREFLKHEYPWFLQTYDSYDSNIKRADSVRYFYMYHYGGVYSDLDVICLKSFEHLFKMYDIADVIVGRKGMLTSINGIPNVVMISKPKSRFWLQVIREMSKRSNCSTPMYDTGPEVLHASFMKTSESVLLLPSHILYPLDWESASVRVVRHSNRHKHAWKYSNQTISYTYWRHSWG